MFASFLFEKNSRKYITVVCLFFKLYLLVKKKSKKLRNRINFRVANSLFRCEYGMNDGHIVGNGFKLQLVGSLLVFNETSVDESHCLSVK